MESALQESFRKEYLSIYYIASLFPPLLFSRFPVTFISYIQQINKFPLASRAKIHSRDSTFLPHRADKMCYSEIEKFACGHEDKHKIPCEAFCDNGSCSKPEADQVRDDAGPKCNKCKEDDDEMDFIQEELRKFAEQESLNPSAASAARPRDPNAPKHYFKRCIVWSRCGRTYTP